jgi:hypothetical protein
LEDDSAMVTGEGRSASDPASQSAARRRTRWAWARFAVGLVVVVGLLGLAADYLTASPRLCASCHEITARAASWDHSPHAGVPCVSCHQTPRPWYALPVRLFDRGALIGRDVAKHLAGGYRDPVDSRISGRTMPDAVCLQCHDANRKATSGFRIIIDHVAHAKRNGSCVSCHVRTAHPVDTRGAALSLMSACFACHGSLGQPKASARCGVCHPSGYQLIPASHKASAWKQGHGKVALADLKQCEMCHVKTMCDSCHGIEMPHPMGWAASGHGASAQRDRTLCAACHGGANNMCTMCHHESFQPAKGTWTQQHSADAEKRGVSFCLGCHSPLDCVRCHKK